MKLKIERLNDNASLPKYESPGAAAFDLSTDGSIDYDESGNAICGTGLKFEIPNDHVMLVFSRSGHGFKNDISLSNSVGVIDSDYRGEVKIKLTAATKSGQEVLDQIKQGDRLAQGLIVYCPQIEIVESDNLSETERGSNGFGSTGQ